MILFIFLSAIILSIAFPKSKIITILWGILLIINVVCTTQSADVIALEYRYNQKGFSDFPPLFRGLMRICSENNISFLQFRFLYILLVVIVLFVVIAYFTHQTALSMMLVSIYPGWCFIGQIRNTIGAAIVILGIAYLIKSDNKRRKIIYFLCVGAATFIHPSCIIYLLVLFFTNDKVKISNKIIISYVLLIVFLYTNALYRFVSLFLHDERVLQYLRVSISSNLFGSAMVVIGQFILTFVSVRQLKKARNDSFFGETKLRKEHYDLMIKINYALLVLIPFYGINHAIFRVYKYFLILNLCVLSSSVYIGKKIRITRLVIVIAMVFLSLAVQITVDGSFRDIIKLFDNLDLMQLSNIF